MERFQIEFIGRVQGVGFRYFVRQLADKYNCAGWVQNQYDGSVLCEIQGGDIDIERVLYEILNGNYIIRAKINQKTSMPVQKEKGFHIRY